ncbi:hypothetical protein CEUSTIGMA_g8424.t1 [Chlamydomonas eustigma]|uniref:Uncharacterized protein n=1 Tax=Chlamydomonas eustigma TaxID=1157962 RepID=A0A250XDJ7_9CHLO|nr:hypothetical protein CEUSTIGMA_g8424.t1 [Chlamydomonas eustigma]|eukprot:GAX80989.1 hypothetical protein CEUSTIGMA_g8424.t1 [Chlamydomonas eustigma]
MDVISRPSVKTFQRCNSSCFQNACKRTVKDTCMIYRSHNLHRSDVRAAALPPAEITFGVTTALMVPLYTVLIAAPSSKLARSIGTTSTIPLALSALYLFTLLQALLSGLGDSIWGVFSSFVEASRSNSPADGSGLKALGDLFKDPLTTALTWVHLLLLDFYQAREIYVQGIQEAVSTRHSLALCFMFGPLGLLSHTITKSALMPRNKRA